MIEYIAKTEIEGIEIRLMSSRHLHVVVYGMTSTEYPTMPEAALAYQECIEHALSLAGAFDEPIL